MDCVIRRKIYAYSADTLCGLHAFDFRETKGIIQMAIRGRQDPARIVGRDSHCVIFGNYHIHYIRESKNSSKQSKI